MGILAWSQRNNNVKIIQLIQAINITRSITGSPMGNLEKFLKEPTSSHSDFFSRILIGTTLFLIDASFRVVDGIHYLV